MLKTLTFTSALLASAMAYHAKKLDLTDAEKATKYPDYDGDMQRLGYTYDAFEVTTDDGYILTTFHVTSNKNKVVKPDPSLNPVMLMHGLGCDSTMWIYGDWDEPSIPIHLFDDGFDVWMAQNRGTKYC